MNKRSLSLTKHTGKQASKQFTAEKKSIQCGKRNLQKRGIPLSITWDILFILLRVERNGGKCDMRTVNVGLYTYTQNII